MDILLVDTKNITHQTEGYRRSAIAYITMDTTRMIAVFHLQYLEKMIKLVDRLLCREEVTSHMLLNVAIAKTAVEKRGWKGLIFLLVHQFQFVCNSIDECFRYTTLMCYSFN